MKLSTVNILKYTKEIIENTYDFVSTIEAITAAKAKGQVSSSSTQCINGQFIMGAKTWYKNGKWHNENGPASISSIGDYQFFAKNGIIEKIIDDKHAYEFLDGAHIGTKPK